MTLDEAIAQVGGPAIDTQKVKMHASILYVLEQLRSQENSISPSLLVIRECVRELRRYEV